MSTLAAATRPTRRDVLKHPLRSLAAIMLVAVPVALLCISTVFSSSQSAALFLDNPQTSARYHGGICKQSVDGYQVECDDAEPASVSELDLLTENLPEGFHAELNLSGSTTATFGENAATFQFAQVTNDRAPAVGDIFLPTRIMDELGTRIGDQIVIDGDLNLTISGTTPSGTAVVTEPTYLDPGDYSSIESAQTNTVWGNWSIVGPEAFTWSDVRALNAVGFSVTSQDVIDNPPPADEVELAAGSSFNEPFFMVIVYAIFWLIPVLAIAFLALMLISPVFTISVSRQTRNFALLASQGATPRHIRWAVLVYGLFAGVVGALLGSIVGIIGEALWWTNRYPEWPLVINWWWILLIIVVAMVGGTAAAFLPAVLAGRSSIISGIHGGGIDRIMRWRKWMAIGPILLAALGLMFLVLKLTDKQNNVYMTSDAHFYFPWRELLESFGGLLSIVAVAACAPAVVWVLGNLTGPLAVRLASRDLLRQSMRSIPAIAALGAVIFVATSISVSDRAYTERSQVAAESVYPAGTMFLALENGVAADLDAAVTEVEAIVGQSQRVDIYGSKTADMWLNSESFDATRYDWVNGPQSAMGSQITVASPELLELLNAPDADLSGAAALLSSVDALESSSTYTLYRYNSNTYEEEAIAQIKLENRSVLPTLFSETILTPAAFAELELEQEYVGAILVAPQRISANQQSELTQKFSSVAGLNVGFTTWTWNTKKDTIIAAAAITGLIIAVMALVLALSSQQIRRQRVILDAVGAQPNLSRRSNALFGGLSAFGAGILGLTIGHCAALLTASTSVKNAEGATLFYGSLRHIEPNWWYILGFLVVAPLITAAIGWAFTPRAELSEFRD